MSFVYQSYQFFRVYNQNIDVLGPFDQFYALLSVMWQMWGFVKEGESAVAAILPSHMEISYCTFGFCCSKASQVILLSLCHCHISCMDLNQARI